MWFVKKEYLNELANFESVSDLFSKLNTMVEEGKALDSAREGKSSLGMKFNLEMMNNEDYKTVTFTIE